MAQINLKDFLRKNGYRMLKELDRGANWGNGVSEVFIEKTYKEPSKVRAVMEEIRKGARTKTLMKLKQERELRDVESKIKMNMPLPKWQEMEKKKLETPEEHREAQIEHAKKMPDIEQPKEEAKVDSLGRRKKAPFKKLSGDERLYAFGRLKAMLQAHMKDEMIAKALTAEGVTKADGSPIKAHWVSSMRANWDKRPESMQKYAAILMPRKVLGAVSAPGVPPGARAVVVAKAPEVKRSRFGLPITVDMVLQDSNVATEDRLKILQIFVELPASAGAIMEDGNLSIEQKLSVVEALGIRRKPDNPAPQP